MAHKRRRQNENNQLGRDVNNIANRRLPRSTIKIYRRREPLTVYEDRRKWHPEGTRAPARSFSSTRHRLRAVLPKRVQGTFSLSSLYSPPIAVGFREPNRVLICVRRQIRREVLHAKRIAGGSGFKKPKYNEYSRVRC